MTLRGQPQALVLSVIAALILAAGPPARAQGARVAFPDSIREVTATPEAGPHIVRAILSADEAAAPMTFSVSLRMRDFAGLQARLAKGETVSQAEMEARYLPLRSDYDRVAAWLASQGFTTVLADSNHTVITVKGSVSRIAQALNVSFARVAMPGSAGAAAAEYTSAVTAPSLPDDIAGPVLGINRLQPYLRFHHAPIARIPFPRPQDVVGGAAFITPDDVVAGYNMPSAWTGSGQIIAIVDEGSVLSSDLNSFWSTVGSPQTANNVTVVNVNGGPIDSNDQETALDVEWAGALAPGAKIRLYLAPNAVEDPLPQILSDHASFPTMNVISMSWGAIESQSGTKNATITLSQEIAQLTAAGITLFVAAGDGGSNPNPNSGVYSASSPLSVEYPASDPNAIGVAGTTMAFNNSWVNTGETVWNQLSSNPAGATGGGLSTIFSAPSWQTGTPNPSVRCVPDVATLASGTSTLISGGNNQIGALVIVTVATRNSSSVADISVGGTSLATPVWAAIGAQINQARAAVGLSSLGSMGPKIYPLAGTSSFTDITSGNNGAYTAGVGYDLCSGIGTPKVATLIAALGGSSSPIITAQPQSVTTTLGSGFSFSVTALGSAPLSYQWSLNGVAISGATSATYSKSVSVSTDAGSYTVVVSNAQGSATSTAATLTVNNPAPPAPAGGGGGGGAPSIWFYGALGLLFAVRQIYTTQKDSFRPGLFP